MYCFICGSRRVVLARYQIIGLVLVDYYRSRLQVGICLSCYPLMQMYNLNYTFYIKDIKLLLSKTAPFTDRLMHDLKKVCCQKIILSESYSNTISSSNEVTYKNTYRQSSFRALCISSFLSLTFSALLTKKVPHYWKTQYLLTFVRSGKSKSLCCLLGNQIKTLNCNRLA